MDRTVTTATDQTFTCSISGLSQDTTVTWIDPDDNAISISDTNNYVIDQGTLNLGNKQSTLTVKADQFSRLTSGDIFKCSLKSSLYPTYSPDVTEDMIVTLLSLSKFTTSLQRCEICFTVNVAT